MEKDLEGFRPEENMETEDFATLLDSGFSGPFRYLSVGDASRPLSWESVMILC